MRPVTRIRLLAEEALAAYDQRGNADVTLMDKNLKEINAIAIDLDARTGTIDPSQKKGWFRRLIGG